MANYAKSLARDVNGNPMQEYPAPYISLGRNQNTNVITSSVVALNPNTSALEVGAVGGEGLVIRWIPVTETASQTPFASVISSGLGANYDHFIPANSYRRFVVPKETQGQLAGGQVGSVNGLYQRVAIMNAGIVGSSVLTSEF